MNECQICGTPTACNCDDDLVLSGWWLVLAATAFFAIGIGAGQIIKF
jgi:hypothetical protein